MIMFASEKMNGTPTRLWKNGILKGNFNSMNNPQTESASDMFWQFSICFFFLLIGKAHMHNHQIRKKIFLERGNLSQISMEIS